MKFFKFVELSQEIWEWLGSDAHVPRTMIWILALAGSSIFVSNLIDIYYLYIVNNVCTASSTYSYFSPILAELNLYYLHCSL